MATPEISKALTIIDTEPFSVTNGTTTVTYERTFSTTNYNTICLPFSLTSAQITQYFGAGTQLFKFIDDPDNPRVLNFVESTSLEANVPYFMLTQTTTTSFTFSSVTLVSSSNPVTEGTNFDFVGNYNGKINIPYGGYFLSGSALYKSIGKSTTKNCRAYIMPKDASYISFNVNLDGNTIAMYSSKKFADLESLKTVTSAIKTYVDSKDSEKLNKSDLVQATDSISGIVKVDTYLSESSENPVQNKVIQTAITNAEKKITKYNFNVDSDLTTEFTIDQSKQDSGGFVYFGNVVSVGTCINNTHPIVSWNNSNGYLAPYIVDDTLYETSFYIRYGQYIFTPKAIGKVSKKVTLYSDSQFIYQHNSPKSIRLCTKDSDGNLVNIKQTDSTLDFYGILEVQCKESDSETTTILGIWNKNYGFLRYSSFYSLTIDGPQSSTYLYATPMANATSINEALDKKVDAVTGKGLSTNDYTTAEKTKLAGIAKNANNYTLPKATSTVLGGITVGKGITLTDGKITVPDATTSSSGLLCATDKIKLDNLENITKYTTLHYDSAKNIPFQSGSTTLRVNGRYLTDQASGGAECTGGEYGSFLTIIANGQAVSDILIEEGGQIAIDRDGNRWEPDGIKWNKKFTSISIESEVLPNSTNPVQSKALYKIITDNEQVTAAALSDLDDRLNQLLNRKRIYVKQYGSSRFYDGVSFYVTPGETINFAVTQSTGTEATSCIAVSLESGKTAPTMSVGVPTTIESMGSYKIFKISMTIPTDVEDGDIYIYKLTVS